MNFFGSGERSVLQFVQAGSRGVHRPFMDEAIPHAVFWDLDGTLIDSEPIHEESLIATLHSVSVVPPDDLHRIIIGRSGPEVYQWLIKRYPIPLDYPTWIARKYQFYFQSVDRLKPRCGALEIYAELARRGLPQAVVSNSDRMIVDANLKALGIVEPGLCSVSINDVRNGKPDPEPYLRAAWLLGCEKSGGFVVEDSPPGAAAGVAAGFRTIMWPQQSDLEAPAGAEVVHDATALAAALRVGRPDR